MKIALIGGSGFIGTRLIDCLTNSTDGFKCKNIDLLPSKFFNEITHIGDVRSQEQMDHELQGADLVVLLAAKHRDDVHPVSLYYETNVEGMKVTLKAMEKNGIHRLVFFSSVAIYGLDKPNPNEDFPADPFNHYGRSKWEAEKIAREWWEGHKDWNIDIIRPTVVFGERNRGNVFNLLNQIQSGRFLMVGKGTNVKSMAYVENVVAFIKWLIINQTEGYNVFNYIDKPDLDMNRLVSHVGKVLGKHIPTIRLPFWAGMAGGYCFDLLALISRKKLSISSVRVRKFCSTTQFDSSKVMKTGFTPPCSLEEGIARTLEYEFIHPRKDETVFVSE